MFGRFRLKNIIENFFSKTGQLTIGLTLSITFIYLLTQLSKKQKVTYMINQPQSAGQERPKPLFQTQNNHTEFQLKTYDNQEVYINKITDENKKYSITLSMDIDAFLKIKDNILGDYSVYININSLIKHPTHKSLTLMFNNYSNKEDVILNNSKKCLALINEIDLILAKNTTENNSSTETYALYKLSLFETPKPTSLSNYLNTINNTISDAQKNLKHARHKIKKTQETLDFVTESLLYRALSFQWQNDPSSREFKPSEEMEKYNRIIAFENERLAECKLLLANFYKELYAHRILVKSIYEHQQEHFKSEDIISTEHINKKLEFLLNHLGFDNQTIGCVLGREPNSSNTMTR